MLEVPQKLPSTCAGKVASSQFQDRPLLPHSAWSQCHVTLSETHFSGQTKNSGPDPMHESRQYYIHTVLQASRNAHREKREPRLTTTPTIDSGKTRVCEKRQPSADHRVQLSSQDGCIQLKMLTLALAQCRAAVAYCIQHKADSTPKKIP